MKTLNLYRVTVKPAAKSRRGTPVFGSAFLTNPTKAEILEAVGHMATELRKQLDDARETDDELAEHDVKEHLENLAVVLEILNAWKPEPHTVDSGCPIGVFVAGVQIGVIKFESEPVFDVRV
jgi:hypothetical protein